MCYIVDGFEIDVRDCCGLNCVVMFLVVVSIVIGVVVVLIEYLHCLSFVVVEGDVWFVGR